MQKAVKVVCDRLLSLIALIVLSPVMLIAAIGIKLSSKGPVFYKAQRMGKEMIPIVVYKFRTMKVGADKEGSITGINDSRIFPWGEFLRKTKIDELPQLLNILMGTMSIIGPRPEDVQIVIESYSEAEKKTLDVLPGLASPGSIFNYTHGDQYLNEESVDNSYTDTYLHIKLSLDLYYLEHWNLLYDAELIIRTIYVIIMTCVLKKTMPFPKEYRNIKAPEQKTGIDQ